MPKADQATIDLLTDYFDAMEAKDSTRLASYYADNITLTFANAPQSYGALTVLRRFDRICLIQDTRRPRNLAHRIRDHLQCLRFIDAAGNRQPPELVEAAQIAGEEIAVEE